MDAIQEVSKFALAIISIINPIGAIPVFLALTVENSDDEIKHIARTCGLVIFVTTTISLYFGDSILSGFGITIPSFMIGGGILIGSNAFNMLRAQTNETKLNKGEIKRTKEDIREMGIVPLGIPLLAGPGTISTSIIYSEKLHGALSWSGAVASIALICVAVYLILSFSRKISHKFGRVGVNVMSRVMGLILMALAVEIISNGVKQTFVTLQ